METYVVAFIPTVPAYSGGQGVTFAESTYEELDAPDDETAKKIFQDEYSKEGFEKRHVPPTTVALYKKLDEINPR
jgi:hypothetical protein